MSAEDLAEVLLHEYWQISASGSNAYRDGGDFEALTFEWSQTVINQNNLD